MLSTANIAPTGNTACTRREDLGKPPIFSRDRIAREVCFAWALVPNHAHFLLRTAGVPLASLMRRLLTGYAVTVNRRHRRHGQLFQNRYKSIVSESEGGQIYS